MKICKPYASKTTGKFAGTFDFNISRDIPDLVQVPTLPERGTDLWDGEKWVRVDGPFDAVKAIVERAL